MAWRVLSCGMPGVSRWREGVLCRADRWALVLSMLAVGSIATIPLLLPLDVAAYGWLIRHRGCATHALAWWLDVIARMTIAIPLMLLVARDSRRMQTVLALLLIVGLGAFLGELLKTGIERLRPSSLPGVASGNSLPSGHIMNTTVFAACAFAAASRARVGGAIRAGVAATSVLAVVAQSVGRVLRGSHWPTDVVPSVLFGLASMLATPTMLRSARVRIAVLVVAGAAYALFYFDPSMRLRVPSILDDDAKIVAAAGGLTGMISVGDQKRRVSCAYVTTPAPE